MNNEGSEEDNDLIDQNEKHSISSEIKSYESKATEGKINEELVY